MASDIPFSTEDLTRLYRFALLLAGTEEKAGEAMREACADCGQRLSGFRNDDSRMACIVGTLRQKARTAAAGGAAPGASHGVARAFMTLPEEERAALAALYTGLLPARVLAESMKLSLEQLGRVLKAAREKLEQATSLEQAAP